MGVTAKLLKMYNLYPKQQSGSKQVDLRPGRTDKRTGRFQAVNLPPEYERLLLKYISENLDTYTTLKNRLDRYKDLEFIRYNVAIMGRAIQMYADETLNPDTQNQYLNVFAADPEVEKYIKQWMTSAGITQQMLLGVSYDLALYGDHFWHHTIDVEKGIVEITPIPVRAIVDRVEFNAMRTLESSITKKEMESFIGRSEVLQRIWDRIRDQDRNSADGAGDFFKNYLFGYQLQGGLVVPPWSITHFRREPASSEFAPYGRPLMINAISPSRQLQTAKSLMQVARASNFPIKHFQIKTDSGQGPAQQWETVNSAQAEYHNLSKTTTLKDQPSVANEIWSPEGILTLNVLQSQINMDQIADVEMLNDDTILASGVPRGYVDPSSGGWGDSGKNLTMQHKLFGRGVYTNQTALLEGLNAAVRLQFALTGKFPVHTDFEMSLNYPALERSADQIRQQQDTMQLANDVLERMSQVMGLQPTDVPTDVIKDIFSKFSFIPSEQLDVWLKSLQNVRRDKFIQGGGEAGPGSGLDVGGGLGDITGGMAGFGGGDTGGGLGDLGPGPDLGGGAPTPGDPFGLDANAPPTGGDASGGLDAGAGVDDVLGSVGNSLDGMGFGSAEGKKSGRVQDSVQRRRRDKAIREKIAKRLNEAVIREAYFTAKKSLLLQESCLNDRHTLGSWAVSRSEALVLEELQAQRGKESLHD